jgi:DNA-directed RNA polymerase specialized sigma24 family protein
VDAHIDARRALGKLKRRQREVLVSSFWEGRTINETAEEMGVTVCNAAWIKADSLRTLRAA